MRIRTYGAVSGRHYVALIGVWDPLLNEQRDLFQRVVADADQSGRSVVAITLHPAPAALIHGAAVIPTCDDIAARLVWQRLCGVSTQVVARLGKREIETCGVDYLLSPVRAAVAIDQLWLGAGQSLGRGQRGNNQAIRQYCAEHRIDIQPLGMPADMSRVGLARGYLRQGRLGEAVRLLGRPLAWARPRSADIHLPWPPGRYQAIPLRTLDLAMDFATTPVAVELEPASKGSRLRWPDRRWNWLAFTAGPEDSG